MSDETDSGKTTEEAKKNKEVTEETNEATKEQLDLQGRLAELLRNNVKESREYYEIIQKTAVTLNDMTEARKAQSTLIEMQMAETLKGDEKKLAYLKEWIAAVKEGEEVSIGAQEALQDFTDEQLKSNAEILLQNERALKGQRKYGSEQKQIISSMAKSIGLTDKYADTTLAKIYTGLEVVGKGGDEALEYMAAMMDNVKKTFNVKNIALNVFNAIKDNSIELFGAFDKAQASLAAATGQGDKFRGTLYEVGREGNLFGVSMDDAGKAIGTMVDQTSNFTSMSKATQASLALNVAKMEKLGVATADSAQIFQNFNQGLGMTADESMRMQTELAMAGVSIGVNAAKMTKDFNSSLSTLMVYGRESVDVFKGIAAAAKAAGVETSTLLGIASKFDTFAGAAEGAGKLNALLGTQLSTTEMLMATEDERIRMLVESVQSQGVAFQDLDRFTQKAIANSVGITDMAEANRIFGMSLEAYDENERKLNASADAQKKLDDAVAKTVPVMDQFKKLGAEIVVALEPFLENLEAVAKGMTDFFKSMDTEDKERLAWFLSLGSAFILLVPILKAGGAFLTGFKLLGATLLPMVGLGGTAAAAGIAETGAASAAAAAPTASFAGALGAVALEIIGIVLAAALLVAAFSLVAYGWAEVGRVIIGVIDSIAGLFTSLVDSVVTGALAIGSAIGAMFGTSEIDMQIKELETRSVEAMASIASSLGGDNSLVEKTKAMVDEINKIGQDVKVSSTIENLALITAGQATSMTGERISASTTSVTANVQNFFDNMTMTVKIGERDFEGYVAEIANI